jgi:membrane dipeptidase
MSLLTALSPVYTRYIPIIIVVNILLFTHLSGQQPPNDEKLRQLADKLAHQFIIVDGHVDLPYRLLEQDFIKTQDFASLISTTQGDFDYERAKKGGLSAPFMSIYVPSGYQLTGGAKVFADTLIDMVAGIAAHFPDKFALADSPEQVMKNFKKGLISLPMGMENGAPIEDDLANVAYFHQRHIRYITLTHGKDNQICDSSYDTLHTWHGVSPFGEKVIGEMNRTGIMIDVSHLSDEAFYDVMKLSKKPCIASHSSCRHFTTGWERNMNDEMIAVLAKNGGVIQINFGTMFLDNTYRETNRKTSNQLDSLLKIQGLTQEDEKAKPYIDAFRKTHPKLYADVALVADHIDHAVRIAGIDHVGLGSDYDGVGDNLPEGLKDVSQYPNLIYELLKRGYSKKDIAKICYKNVFRVWGEVSKSKV